MGRDKGGWWRMFLCQWQRNSWYRIKLGSFFSYSSFVFFNEIVPGSAACFSRSRSLVPRLHTYETRGSKVRVLTHRTGLSARLLRCKNVITAHKCCFFTPLQSDLSLSDNTHTTFQTQLERHLLLTRLTATESIKWTRQSPHPHTTITSDAENP